MVLLETGTAHISVFSVGSRVTASFNNIWTLKFKIQPTVTLFTAVNYRNKKQRLVQRGQTFMLVRCDWRISIHFVGFCIFVVSPVVAVIMIDSSKTRNSLVGLKFRVQSQSAIERRSTKTAPCKCWIRCGTSIFIFIFDKLSHCPTSKFLYCG